ncbi:unnamed protein product [Lactuca virosa]|uniref:Pentacotripeptide-repeat region of PRORP domain-containing protein n=1 Tax=Lactuca virosa TaxID=75947 RepID=A0AAU9M2F5_9ASTR|nr:unnamed protein product [Lactuca virosa]
MLRFKISPIITLNARNFATKSYQNAVSLYLERARLIDKIRIILRSNSQNSLASILNHPSLDTFVVANALNSAPSPHSALSLIETLKTIPHFTHNQNTLHALAKILAKSGQIGKLKALVNGINSGKFRNVARVSFMDQMKLYASANDLESVLSVWHEWKLSQKPPNVESYNIIMSLCAQTGKDYEAVKTFSRMIDEGQIPNCRTYTVIIEHLVKSGNLNPAMEIFTILPSMKVKVKRTLRQYMILVEAFCGINQFDVVKTLLDEMQVDGILPTRRVLSSLQKMHDAGFVEETLELIKEMSPDERIQNVTLSDDNDDDVDDEDVDKVKVKFKLRPWFDPRILASSLRFWRSEEVSTLENAKFIWTTHLISKMIRSFTSADSAWEFFNWVANQKGFTHDAHTISKIITKLALEGRVDFVQQLIPKIKSENIQLSCNTVKTVIDYYGISHNGEAALRIFQDLNTLCGNLSKKSLLSLYSSLLTTLGKCKMGCEVLDTLDEMILSGVVPEIQTFCKLMHWFGVEGDVKTVQRLFWMVKQSGLQPDSDMFKILICVYCKLNRVALGFRAFEDMKSYDLMFDVSTKSLLVKSLWKEGKLREAAYVEEESIEMNDDLMSVDLQRVYGVYYDSFSITNDKKDLCEIESLNT